MHILNHLNLHVNCISGYMTVSQAERLKSFLEIEMRWQLLSILFFIIFLLDCGNPSTASELGRHDIPPTFWSAAGFLLLLFCLFLAGVLFFWCHP